MRARRPRRDDQVPVAPPTAVMAIILDVDHPGIEDFTETEVK
ncbi:hypothetical protein [Streptomyces sp. LX-29]|nr:hypothetical protein [Streptomyces sp. LX-29]